MIIQKKFKDEFLVLCFNNRQGHNDDKAIAEAIQKEVDDGHVNIALDLSGIVSLSSFGIGVLVQYWHRLKNIKGELVIINPSKSLSMLFSATKLDAVVRILKVED